MGRKTEPEQKRETGAWLLWLRYGAFSVAVLAAIGAALLLFNRLDQFLATEERFHLKPPDESGETPSLVVKGVVYASRRRIVEVFAGDFGHSLYLVPLKERRRTLLEIDWVRDAAVSRLWPDRLVVSIVERTPVAFVQIPASAGEGPAETALVDEEGVILRMPERADFKLPVLTGIRRQQSQEARRARVAAAMKLLSEAGALAEKFSEIDVQDPADLRVLQEVGGRVVMLYLGNRNFQSRLRNFLNHYDQIQQRIPEAATFDLRLDDRITAIKEAPSRG